jgi:actin-like protein 6A
VVDIGTSTVRAGYAGDDTPKAIIPTYYGYKLQQPDQDASMMEMQDESAEAPSQATKVAKMYIGQDGPSVWREGMEIGNPMKDGLSACTHFFRIMVYSNAVSSR